MRAILGGFVKEAGVKRLARLLAAATKKETPELVDAVGVAAQKVTRRVEKVDAILPHEHVHAMTGRIRVFHGTSKKSVRGILARGLEKRKKSQYRLSPFWHPPRSYTTTSKVVARKYEGGELLGDGHRGRILSAHVRTWGRDGAKRTLNPYSRQEYDKHMREAVQQFAETQEGWRRRDGGFFRQVTSKRYPDQVRWMRRSKASRGPHYRKYRSANEKFDTSDPRRKRYRALKTKLNKNEVRLIRNVARSIAEEGMRKSNESGAVVFRSVPRQFIRESKHFQPMTGREVVDYAKRYPERVAAGLRGATRKRRRRTRVGSRR